MIRKSDPFTVEQQLTTDLNNNSRQSVREKRKHGQEERGRERRRGKREGEKEDRGIERERE